MVRASLTVYEIRRRLHVRYLKWRTELQRETAIEYLDALAPELEAYGWRCVRTYYPEVIPVRPPLLRVYGELGPVTTLNVMAVPGGRWGFHEAARGRRGFLSPCEGDIKGAAEGIDHFLRARAARSIS
ncbi:hypothetical protein [Actinomadura sp. NEAU-AAG7]|uniref:hypothetical protein n=1 Tax=Actinomadura sp. NEAU-AAG7 TaxID=2839640 RepID=UPI001BE3FC9C|nr:hypothetical protein [Actinomadura sp. NEAU-AAG7]MBT2206883.1 hypothetical protein [Actinomadura sp. NEAU-AAG7]